MHRSFCREPLFARPDDFWEFLGLLAEALERYPPELLAFCVLSTHWRLVLRVEHTADLSRFMHWLTTTHARAWRDRRGVTGVRRVYKDRFISTPVATVSDLARVCRHVERSPLKAGLVRHAEDWPWSSLSARQRGDHGVPLVKAPFLESRIWAQHVNQALKPTELASLVRLGLPRLTEHRQVPHRSNLSPGVPGTTDSVENRHDPL